MNLLEKNGFLLLALLAGGLGLYLLLKKQSAAAQFARPQNRYTRPATGGTVAADLTAGSNAFATIYRLLAGGGSQSGSPIDTPTTPGGPPVFAGPDVNPTTGGYTGGVSDSTVVSGVWDPFGSDPGTFFDTGGSIADSSYDPSTMDVTGVTGDVGFDAAYA